MSSNSQCNLLLKLEAFLKAGEVVLLACLLKKMQLTDQTH